MGCSNIFLLQVVQVILTPISHYSVGLVGGFIFGPVYGTILNVIGRTVGHFAAFTISRYVLRPLFQANVSERIVSKLDKWVGGSGFILFLAYWLPFFPDDELSYIAGLSEMSWKKFALANVFGQFGGAVALGYAGAATKLDLTAYSMIFISLLCGCISFWIIRKKNSTL